MGTLYPSGTSKVSMATKSLYPMPGVLNNAVSRVPAPAVFSLKRGTAVPHHAPPPHHAILPRNGWSEAFHRDRPAKLVSCAYSSIVALAKQLLQVHTTRRHE